MFRPRAATPAGRLQKLTVVFFGRTQLVLEPMTDPAAAAQGLDAVFLATEHIVSAAWRRYLLLKRSGL